MERKLKKERIRKIINRLEEIENSKDIDLIVDDRIIKVLEVILNIKPYAKKPSQVVEKKEVKRISCKRLRKKKSSSK